MRFFLWYNVNEKEEKNMKEKIPRVENEMRDCFRTYSPYPFDYSRVSLQKNLEMWALNKEYLYEVLKLHPDFDEDALAIVTTGKVTRKAHPIAICNFGESLNTTGIQCLLERFALCADEEEKKTIEAKIYNWGMRVYFSSHADGTPEVNDVPEIRQEFVERRKSTHESYFDIACSLIKDGGSFYIAENALALVLGHLQIKPGMKKSRAFMKFLDKIQPLIDKSLLVDIRSLVNDPNVPPVKNETGEETYFYNYNQLIALLCDLLSPKEISKPMIISIHPCDYITQSHGNGWKSCHSFEEDECYNGATLTMLTDSTSIIAYFLEEKTYKEALEKGIPLWALRKSMRLILFANRGVILQNMVYPTKSLAGGDQVSDILKELINKHEKIAIRWIEVTTGYQDLYIDDSDYEGYKDWDRTRKYRLFVDANAERLVLKIGHEAYCYNTDALVRDNKMIGNNCIRCDNCGDWVDEDDVIWVDGFGGYICPGCAENDGDFYECRGSGYWYYEPRDPSIEINGYQYNLRYAERNIDFIVCESCEDAVYADYACFIVDNEGYEHAFCCSSCLDYYVEAYPEMFEETEDEEESEDDN